MIAEYEEGATSMTDSREQEPGWREASEGGVSICRDLASAMVQAAAAASVSTDGRSVVWFSNHPALFNPEVGEYRVFRSDDPSSDELPSGEGWTLLYVVHRPDRHR